MCPLRWTGLRAQREPDPTYWNLLCLWVKRTKEWTGYTICLHLGSTSGCDSPGRWGQEGAIPLCLAVYPIVCTPLFTRSVWSGSTLPPVKGHTELKLGLPLPRWGWNSPPHWATCRLRPRPRRTSRAAPRPPLPRWSAETRDDIETWAVVAIRKKREV